LDVKIAGDNLRDAEVLNVDDRLSKNIADTKEDFADFGDAASAGATLYAASSGLNQNSYDII
jgi:hypothetical protein